MGEGNLLWFHTLTYYFLRYATKIDLDLYIDQELSP